MRVVNEASGLAEFHGGVCVPTMGALHRGHASLIESARQAVGAAGQHGSLRVVVTIFVNPTQFAPGEDFTRYPRTLDTDLKVCEAAGADAVFVPSVETVYPGFDPSSGPLPQPPANTRLPAVATRPRLEDAFRPTHFAGVCQVVRRLFELVRPSKAFFGEKDYQQLLVIRAMAKDEGLPVEIEGRPTVRDADGLALSSRNAYLAPGQRQRALGLSKALAAAAKESSPREAERAMRSVLLAHQVEIDYAAVRDAETLLPIDEYAPGCAARALIAGRVGSVRLIDNAPVPT